MTKYAAYKVLRSSGCSAEYAHLVAGQYLKLSAALFVLAYPYSAEALGL